MLIRTLKGLAVGFLVIVILLVILSFVVVYSPMPYEMSGSIVLAIMIVGMFAGGVTCGVGMQSKGWMRGIMCGSAMLIVLIIAGLIISGGAIVQSGLFKGIILSLLSSMAGGVTGINIRTR